MSIHLKELSFRLHLYYYFYYPLFLFLCVCLSGSRNRADTFMASTNFLMKQLARSTLALILQRPDFYANSHPSLCMCGVLCILCVVFSVMLLYYIIPQKYLFWPKIIWLIWLCGYILFITRRHTSCRGTVPLHISAFETNAQ